MSLLNPKTLGLASTPSFLGGTLGDIMDAIDSAVSAPGAQPGLASPSASQFSTIYAFGDSLSDVGNVYALTLHALPAAPYASGHFTNGAVWVQGLAVKLGLSSPRASVLGGTDFAYGGAKTGSEPLHTQNASDLGSQLAQFKASGPASATTALYTLSIGANDVFDAVSAYSANPTAAVADIAQAVRNETAFIAGLAASGARNFAVLNVPDLGKTPSETARGAGTVQIASYLSALYDSQLSASLKSLAATAHLNLHLVDTYSFLDQGIANPAAFGLTNVTRPVWTGTYNNPKSGTLNATGAVQNGYLFFDGIHPSATGHALLANAAYNSLFQTA